MGRPRKEFDIETFEKLCKIQCTREEIANWFSMSMDTLETRIKETYDSTFSAIFAEKRDGGRISLRRQQYQKAIDGNITMLIWLGKQYLGQKDKQEIEDISDKKQTLIIDFTGEHSKKE